MARAIPLKTNELSLGHHVQPRHAMQSFVQDLRYALRMIQRNPGFTATAVLALGLGIGANTAVFTVLNGVLLESLPFPAPGRLFLVSNAPGRGPFGPMLGLTEHDYLEFQRQDQMFQGFAAFNGNRVSLTGAGEPIRLHNANVTADFLKVLRVKPALGRDFVTEEERPGRNHVALIADELWRNRFAADREILGKVIQLDGVAHAIIGVMPAGFRFPYEAEVWLPLEVREDPHNAFFRPTVGRLKPGRTRQQAQAELETIASGLPTRTRNLAQILPLKELVTGDVRASLLIFAGAVAFVLLIACANVANLFLMRAAARQPEIAVRAALGAGRWRLIRQLLTESLLVSLGGGAAGILLAVWGVPALLALAPEGRIPRMGDIRIDAPVLAFTLGLSLLTGLAFGAAPALHATRGPKRESLSHGARASEAQGRLRSALAIAEIALALILLTGAGLMIRSLVRLRAVDPGFRPENVLTMTVDLPPAVYRQARDMQSFHARVLGRLRTIPGITAAGAVNWLPLGGMLTKGDFQLQGRKLPPGYMTDKLVVSPGYFRAMGIRLMSGRDFSDRDTADAPGAAVISRSVARLLWPGEDPLGKQISESDHPKPGDWMTIIGVVDDVRQANLTGGPSHALYFPYLQTPNAGWLPHMSFVVRTATGGSQAARNMRAALYGIDPDQPVEKTVSMQDLLASATAEPVFQARLLTAFSLLALVLAVIGVYGVLAYSVAMRTREIGIRMALGAEAGDVMRLVLRRTLLLAGAGLTVGASGALVATRVLTKFLFEVKPNDAATFAIVALILGAVAIAGGWIPARRAARVDPLVALRYE